MYHDQHSPREVDVKSISESSACDNSSQNATPPRRRVDSVPIARLRWEALSQVMESARYGSAKRLPTPQEPSLGTLHTDRRTLPEHGDPQLLPLFLPRKAALCGSNAVAAQPGIDSPVRREPCISSLAKGQQGAARSAAHSNAEDLEGSHADFRQDADGQDHHAGRGLL